MGGEGKRDVERECLCGPLRGEASVIRGAKTISGVGGMPSVVNVREEVRRGGGREGGEEGEKTLRVGDGMRIGGEAIGCPGGFGGRGDVGGGEEEEFTGEIAKGSIGIDGEGDKEDFRGVKESNNRFVTEFFTSTFIMR
jgi:hypothetical protein